MPRMKHFKLVQAIEDLIETVDKAHVAFQKRYDGEVADCLHRTKNQAERLRRMTDDIISKGIVL
jgi:hypothetical protein